MILLLGPARRRHARAQPILHQMNDLVVQLIGHGAVKHGDIAGRLLKADTKAPDNELVQARHQPLNKKCSQLQVDRRVKLALSYTTRQQCPEMPAAGGLQAAQHLIAKRKLVGDGRGASGA